MERAGRYEIVEEVGRGSMGVVYKAYDPVINRTVAIKTMLSRGLAPGDFEAFRARFQFEAQSAGTLTHPNIITVYDFGEEEGMLYLAMEYMQGKSLQKLVEEQRILPLETIAPIVEQVGSALDFAHLHKIVHRDVKPANIMILDSGLVKVTDFGTAKGATTNLTTRAGQLLGTPNYMSPEQAKGRTLDGRSDIFALGVILYELLTGEKPFYGESVTTVIYKIVHDTPIPPRELDPTIHPGLNFVVSKALAKSPDDRYQSCRELVDDLKNYRNLGAMAASNETVVLTRPLAVTSGPAAAATASARPGAVGAAPVLQPATATDAPGKGTVATAVATVAPPRGPAVVADTHEEKHSPLVWLLPLTLLVLALIVGLILYRKHAAPPVAGNLPATPPASQIGPEQPPPGQAQSPGAKPADNKLSAPETTGATPSEPPVSRPIKPIPEKASKSAGMGTLNIRSNVPAKILIDGNLKDGWLTPHPAQLQVGKHRVSLVADNYQTASQEVEVTAGGEQPVNFELTAVLGALRIETTPPGLEVLIDGKSSGLSPVTVPLPAGPHVYKVMPPPGGSPGENTVQITANNTLMVRLHF
ncbi:MAG TPA: protein kinase [Terriglobia bacterium]|nr:protein kinase [Terriglobia bacterium]